MKEKLYHNGHFVPMTSKDATFDALVVAADGTIAFTGGLEEARACAPDAKEIDLQGKTLMPGFVDPHSHFAMADQMVTQADLSECTSFSEIQKVLSAFLKEGGITSEGAVIGRGYDQNYLEEQNHPDKYLLDEVSRDVPIFINHVSGHMGVANTKALEVCGLTSDTPDPEGGRYGRVDDTAELNGFCEEVSAILPILPVMDARVEADRKQIVRKVQDIYMSFGITTCQDGASLLMFLDKLMPSVEENLLDIDVVGYPVFTMGQDQVRADYPQYFSQAYHNHFRFGGLKIVLDGSPQGRTAWMSEPYEYKEGEPQDWCAYPSLTDEVVTASAQEAIDNNFQLLAHCNGDAASEQLLRCYQAAFDASNNPNKAQLRPVMIHCQTARRDQYERMSALNMIPSVFTSHIWYWGDIHLKNFGQARGSRISAVRDAQECGLVFNFHTDAPIVPPNMLLAVWCGVNRITKKGVQLDESQKVDVFDGLRAITINAAYEYGEEDRKGTLEKGKLADMVILDRNPLGVDPREIRDIVVLETIKEGTTVWPR